MAVVTISRQAGSLGDEVARELAASLAWSTPVQNDIRVTAFVGWPG